VEQDVVKVSGCRVATNEHFDWLGISMRLAKIAPMVLRGFPSYISTEIDDIVQDTLLKLHRSGFSEQPSPELLRVMLRHAAIDHMRARRRVRSLHDVEFIDSIIDRSTDYDHRTELWQRLNLVLACLSREDQLLLMRYYCRRVKIQQLADEAGVKYSAMAVRLHRIKSKLRDKLDRLGDL
jgi:RNA polymerase sigma factor (sigma-70 family)